MTRKRKSILDTITPEDEITLRLYQSRNTQSPAVTVPGPPSQPLIERVRRDVESHVPGYKVRTEYGFMRDESGQMVRATRLSMFPTEQTVQDHFMDGFEGYFRSKYGDASPI